MLSVQAFAQAPAKPCSAILPAASHPAGDAGAEPLRHMLQAELVARGIEAVLAPGPQEARELGCNVALVMTLKRKDRPGWGNLLRSAAAGSAPQLSTHNGSPASAGVQAPHDAARATALSRTREVIVLEVVATPLTLGESIVRRCFKAQVAQDGEDVAALLVRQAAAVSW